MRCSYTTCIPGFKHRQGKKTISKKTKFFVLKETNKRGNNKNKTIKKFNGLTSKAKLLQVLF